MSRHDQHRHVLVVRLSALGDVAILQPVVKARAEANPDTLFTVAAPPLLEPLFQGINNVHFLAVKKRQPIHHLFKELMSVHPTMVADMHWVNRVIMTDLLFLMHGIPVHHIHKNRIARRRLTSQRHKQLTPLTPSWMLYDQVFDACGLRAPTPPLTETCQKYWTPTPTGTRAIGIAPFAQHRGKIWPKEQMLTLIDLLSREENVRIILFGSKEEAQTLEQWASHYPNVQSIAGQQSFGEELQIIRQMDVMVSMDSANLHFASALGTPVVSLWGATHPYGGFAGWRQNPQWAIQNNTLDCRPCSMYGRKPCQWGDYRCLTSIEPSTVKEMVLSILNGSQK